MLKEQLNFSDKQVLGVLFSFLMGPYWVFILPNIGSLLGLYFTKYWVSIRSLFSHSWVLNLIGSSAKTPARGFRDHRPAGRTVDQSKPAAHLSLRLLCLMRFLTNRWPLTKAMFVQMILSEGLGVYGVPCTLRHIR